jgi:hypothetical protein
MPATTSVISLRCDMTTGLVTAGGVVDASPVKVSIPRLPQQCTVAPLSNEHAYVPLAEMSVARVRSDTARGVDEGVVVPFPS